MFFGAFLLKNTSSFLYDYKSMSPVSKYLPKHRGKDFHDLLHSGTYASLSVCNDRNVGVDFDLPITAFSLSLSKCMTEVLHLAPQCPIGQYLRLFLEKNWPTSKFLRIFAFSDF